MPVNVKKITHERLGSWEKKLIESNATPVILMGIGHDKVSGQIVICVTEDRTNEEIILFLQDAIQELLKAN